MIILPEIYFLSALTLFKFGYIFKNKYTNPIILSFMGFELVALLPALISYSNDILFDPSYLQYPINSENIRHYLFVYVALQLILIVGTNRPYLKFLKINMKTTSAFKYRNLLVLNLVMISTSSMFFSGIKFFILGAMILASYGTFLQIRIATSLIRSRCSMVKSLSILFISGPWFVLFLYGLGISDDLSRLSLAMPFIYYGVYGICVSRIRKIWIPVFLGLFLIQNSVKIIVGGGDFLIVKHGVNVAAAVSEGKVSIEPKHFVYNTGFQLIAPAMGLGYQQLNANSIYQRKFYNRSENEIRSSWGVGITLPGDLILSFGFFGSLIFTFFIGFVYRQILIITCRRRWQSHPWVLSLHLFFCVSIFSALRMDAASLTSMLIFEVIIGIILLSRIKKLIL